ncbi:PA0069 family radical SAM protein [Aureitalea marina]|uniref:Radical SAM protein n=1 Tax=Aureitalea marina TaxID=930804 RepID=A0A2S7KSE8_9FLAO|nr:PA0069 family radical SAM protein [Aureitalea marina]PQB05551.1 radical SAM protein [Aureitalea marina]
MSTPIRGRGAQKKQHNSFDQFRHEVQDDFLQYCELEGEEADNNLTNYQEVFPKSFVNKINSPDVPMEYSANPYQGCEHGCVYCYARNSHEYWGYGAGVDFERNILVKPNAPKLLEKTIRAKSWEGNTIVLSGNTDCYQPIERKLEITRKCLEVFSRWKHPVGIITKNALVLRDIDLLAPLAEINAAAVHISIPTLDEKSRRLMEPRTSSIKNRLKAVETLSKAGIPVNVMMAPIIPALNSHEILPLAKAASDAGALTLIHTLVRLNGKIADVFTDWLEKTLPDKSERILHLIASCHDGKLTDSEFGRRMSGSGALAAQIAQTVKLARRKYFGESRFPKLDNSHFLTLKNPQTSLF